MQQRPRRRRSSKRQKVKLLNRVSALPDPLPEHCRRRIAGTPLTHPGKNREKRKPWISILACQRSQKEKWTPGQCPRKRRRK